MFRRLIGYCQQIARSAAKTGSGRRLVSLDVVTLEGRVTPANLFPLIEPQPNAIAVAAALPPKGPCEPVETMPMIRLDLVGASDAPRTSSWLDVEPWDTETTPEAEPIRSKRGTPEDSEEPTAEPRSAMSDLMVTEEIWAEIEEEIAARAEMNAQ